MDSMWWDVNPVSLFMLTYILSVSLDSRYALGQHLRSTANRQSSPQAVGGMFLTFGVLLACACRFRQE
jgi:hypothetical protein